MASSVDPVPPRPSRLPASRAVPAGRRRIVVRESRGPAGAPTVVLLHGWTSTADINWFTAFDALSDHFHVVAPDLRGHRAGPRSWRPATLALCSDDVADLIHALDSGPAIVAGYSMGGAVAQLLARRQPDLVSGLVLCASAERYRISRAENIRYAGIVAGAALAHVLPAAATTWTARRVMNAMFGMNDFQQWVSEQTARHSWRQVLELAVSLGRFDSTPWITAIRPPVASVITVRDRNVGPKRQRRLASNAGASVHEVDGDHAVCLAEPERFVPALVDACLAVSTTHLRTVTGGTD